MKTQIKSPSIPGRPADVLSPVNGDKSDRDSFNKDNGKSQSTSKHGNLLQEKNWGDAQRKPEHSKNLAAAGCSKLCVHAPIFHG